MKYNIEQQIDKIVESITFLNKKVDDLKLRFEKHKVDEVAHKI